MKKNTMTRLEAWILLIAGLLMGTVFTFGVQHWNRPVTREEAVSVTAVYASFGEQKNRGHVTEIILRFDDHDQLYIDGSCINEDLRNRIHALTPGTELSLLVHPNSSTILELKAGNAVLLDFTRASERLAGEAKSFLWMGLVLYTLAACGLARLLFGKKR